MSREHDQPPEEEAEVSTRREPYRPPALTRHGRVAELTQNGIGAVTQDGPTSYS